MITSLIRKIKLAATEEWEASKRKIDTFYKMKPKVGRKTYVVNWNLILVHVFQALTNVVGERTFHTRQAACHGKLRCGTDTHLSASQVLLKKTTDTHFVFDQTQSHASLFRAALPCWKDEDPEWGRESPSPSAALTGVSVPLLHAVIMHRSYEKILVKAHDLFPHLVSFSLYCSLVRWGSEALHVIVSPARVAGNCESKKVWSSQAGTGPVGPPTGTKPAPNRETYLEEVNQWEEKDDGWKAAEYCWVRKSPHDNLSRSPSGFTLCKQINPTLLPNASIGVYLCKVTRGRVHLEGL